LLLKEITPTNTNHHHKSSPPPYFTTTTHHHLHHNWITSTTTAHHHHRHYFTTPPNHLTKKTGSNTITNLEEEETQQQNTGSDAGLKRNHNPNRKYATAGDKEKAFVAGVINNQTKAPPKLNKERQRNNWPKQYFAIVLRK